MIATQKTRRRVKPARTWVVARKISQGVFLAIFLVLLIEAPLRGWPYDLINLPVRLDPLAMLAGSLAARTLLASSLLALPVIVLTIVFGRAWCGWICPLGTTLDLIPLHSKKKLAAEPSDKWRSVKYSLLIASLAAALFANLSLLFFDPLTIFIRSFGSSLWPTLERAISAIEGALYKIPALGGPLDTLDSLLRPTIFPINPAFYQFSFLFVALFMGIILLNRLAPRFWCRYLCPLGALLGIISKIAIFRRTVQENCSQCGLCQRECPTGTIRPEKGYISDPSECIMCLNCWQDCNKDAVSFAPTFSAAVWNSYDPSKRQALGIFAATLFGVAAFQANLLKKAESQFHILPPGGRENDLFSKCVRCAECVRACPTNAIQVSVFDTGIEGIGTPELVMRSGFCDYSCNVCGQVCPTQAIPLLSLAQKRQTVIGKAYIDKNRCIAWADHRDCIVCQEMCPLPEKAVLLQTAVVTTPDRGDVTVHLPEVSHTRCIGCGICETRCPLTGEAAIRVYLPTM